MAADAVMARRVGDRILPLRVIMPMMILPMPTASAIAEPDMPGEDDVGHHVDVAETAAEASDEQEAEFEQPVGQAAAVHEFGREDEQAAPPAARSC